MITKTSARRETDKKMHTGHFYFAKNRTFLLCVDTVSCFDCSRKMIMSYLCKIEMSYS